MAIKITHRDTGALLYVVDADTLRGVDFTGANLAGAYLRGMDFRGATLAGADFRGADLVDVHFGGATLVSATLVAAALAGTEFRGACLRNTAFRGARIGNHILTRLVAQLQRSSGHSVTAFATEAGDILVRAGCFTGTLAKARAYQPRIEYAWAEENRAICDYIETRARQMGAYND